MYFFYIYTYIFHILHLHLHLHKCKSQTIYTHNTQIYISKLGGFKKIIMNHFGWFFTKVSNLSIDH
jgi:hypothetical protein